MQPDFSTTDSSTTGVIKQMQVTCPRAYSDFKELQTLTL